LIDNARKFTASGAVTVRTSDANGDGVRIEVSGTVTGFDRSVMPRLFAAFEQGEIRTVWQHAGLGLGLAIAKNLIDAHHGTITASSEGRGKGATFVVELPGAR